MRVHLTKRTLDDATGAQDVLWDTELRGFAVRVRASGVKTFVFAYRTAGGRAGRLRWKTIGQYGKLWTLDKARKEAGRIALLAKQGDDPQRLEDEARAALDVRTVADRFLAEHVARLAPATRRDYTAIVRDVLVPKFGTRRPTEITRDDVASLHHQLRKTPTRANRVIAVLSSFCAWARIEPNPCLRAIRKYPETKRQRYLTPVEFGRLGAALDNAAEVEPTAIAIIRVLLLTGMRLGEVLTLEWTQVDLDGGLVTLLRHKTRAKTETARHVHLNDPAVEVLAALPRIVGNPYVFPAVRRGKSGERSHYVGIAKPWRAIVKAADLQDLRLHDLRHSYASVGAGANYALPIIGKLLGHTQAQTTQRYAHLHDAPLRDATRSIGAAIVTALTRRPTSAA